MILNDSAIDFILPPDEVVILAIKNLKQLCPNTSLFVSKLLIAEIMINFNMNSLFNKQT